MRIFGKIWDYSGKQWNPVLGYFEKSWENNPTMGKFSCFQENKIPHFGKKWEYRGQDICSGGGISQQHPKLAPNLKWFFLIQKDLNEKIMMDTCV